LERRITNQQFNPHGRGNLHAYLGGIVRAANGIPESIGGVSDHVHLLIGLRATHRLADVLRELKSVSSGWVHDEIGVRGLAWQEGYGAFTARLHSEKRSGITLNGRKSIIALKRFARSTWNYCAATVWNLIFVMFDCIAPPGRIVMYLLPVVCTTG
jgi:hypothetical protein